MHDVVAKASSGIPGLDEITEGGLPRGRPTLVCGAAGCGKTLLGMQFLVAGAQDHGEPGVFVSFEERSDELATNVASLGWDVADLTDRGLLGLDHIHLDAAEVEEAGSWDLDGLFIRLGAAVDAIGAKRIVIDTLEVLFGALTDETTLRAQLRRLFAWVKDRGLTAVITAERGDGTLTRYGIEEYVSDCVILLDHRVDDHISTRRLQVVKYRGSGHSTDETPFLIDDHGFRVLPLSSLRLEHPASAERVSTGVERLDAMLDGQGYYRGGSMLLSGTPGSGKSTLAASFVRAGCERGEKAIVFAYEESPEQLMRNQRSVGIDLRPHVDSGLLRIVSSRPSAHGLEAHLAQITRTLDNHEPELVTIDPLSAFGASEVDREAMLTRLVDLLKSRGITAVCTSLTTEAQTMAGLGISSVIDAWIHLAAVEQNGERNRSLTIIKARGTSHSNQVREFVMSADGLELVDVFTSGAEVFMGTARQAREAEVAAETAARQARADAMRRQAERRRLTVEAQIEALRNGLANELDVLDQEIRREEDAEGRRVADSEALASSRQADSLEEPA